MEELLAFILLFLATWLGLGLVPRYQRPPEPWTPSRRAEALARGSSHILAPIASGETFYWMGQPFTLETFLRGDADELLG